jgi:hypothetical protein
MLITLYLNNELSYDTYHETQELIFPWIGKSGWRKPLTTWPSTLSL